MFDDGLKKSCVEAYRAFDKVEGSHLPEVAKESDLCPILIRPVQNWEAYKPDLIDRLKLNAYSHKNIASRYTAGTPVFQGSISRSVVSVARVTGRSSSQLDQWFFAYPYI